MVTIPGRAGGFLKVSRSKRLVFGRWSQQSETICAQVRLEIKQELTFERQAFDAQMDIANGLDTSSLNNVSVNVSFADDAGNSVRATSNPSDTTAKFFIRIETTSGVSSIDGQGTIAPSTTAQIHWLIVPTPGAAGGTPVGKLYLVGATLSYTLAGERKTMDVTPDSIYVKPLPKLALAHASMLPHHSGASS